MPLSQTSVNSQTYVGSSPDGATLFGGGTFVANGATAVVVADPRVQLGTIIIPSLRVVGGTVSATLPSVKTITPGVGFTISGLASDTSTYNYVLL